VSSTKDRIDTILASDIHIGSEHSRIRDFMDFVASHRTARRRFRFGRLVLLGDIFDGMEPGPAEGWAAAFRNLLRGLTDAGVEVVWVFGNHDPALPDGFSGMGGLLSCRDFRWAVGARRFWALHGDQYGEWLLSLPDDAVGPCGGLPSMADYAAARGVGADVIIYGHTHRAGSSYFDQQKVWCHNTGCWLGAGAPTYAVVFAGGDVEIREYRR
jgi:UDP-2,3-diacylglucosamine pyrophosphatase LpxH